MTGTDTGRLTGVCHCGDVSIIIRRPPPYINDCNCSLCRRTGAWWGYFDPSDVDVDGETIGYARSDLGPASVELRFCGRCGTTTHWRATPHWIKAAGSDSRMGVNMRLFDDSALMGIEIRFPNGAGWDRSGPYEYRAPPKRFGDR